MSQPRNEAPTRQCLIDECDRFAAPGRTICEGHRKQMARTGRVTPLRRYADPARNLMEAAFAFADAAEADERAFILAWDRLRKASFRYSSTPDKVPTPAANKRTRAVGQSTQRG